MSISEIEKRKCDEIDAILPALWNEGLLTDLECRIITTIDILLKKKAAIYTVIMSKAREKAAILTKIFRRLTAPVAIYPSENSTNLNNASTITSEENNCSVLKSRNPFMHVMIIKHLFGFLSLEDIKLFRLVNREWNSAAEICLRKRSAIHFRPNVLLPKTLEDVSKYTRPDLPFPSFIFSNDEDSSWNVADIQNVLEKWEKDIKEVTFKSIELTRQCNLTGTVVPISNDDITQLFINPSNITSLKINYPMIHVPETNLEISLEKFVSLKALFLSNCTIIVSVEDQSPHYAPLAIALQNVSYIRNGEIEAHFCYNDIFDFSKALDIHLEEYLNCNIMDKILDMNDNVFNANQLKLSNVSLENWEQAKGNIQILHLLGNNFDVQNQLEIKELSVAFSKIEISTLPKTLEFFEFENSEIYCGEPSALPNLKKVSMDIEDCKNFFMLNCANVLELVLRKDGELGLTCIPDSIQRMTIELSQIKFIDYCVYKVDTLILDGRNSQLNIRDCMDIVNHIRAKILLVLVCGAQMDVNTSDVAKFVWTNSQASEILIGSYFDLHKRTQFKGSRLSECVDKKSNYYKFENEVGKSITKVEFEKYITP